MIPPVPEIVGSLFGFIQRWRQGTTGGDAAIDDLSPSSARKRRIRVAIEAYSKNRSTWLGWVAESTLYFIRNTVVLFVGGVENTLRSLITDPQSSIQTVVGAPPGADDFGTSLDQVSSAPMTAESYTPVVLVGDSELGASSSRSGKKSKWLRG